MTKEAQSVGTLLRSLREKRGLSIRQLAEQSGVNHANIVRLERGQASRPTLSLLTKVAEALGADPADFYKAASQADTTLPSFRPYLRAKYGHLPKAKLDELTSFFETIEAEQAAKRSRRRSS